nr:DUF3465 domain-containing protein [Leptothoe spongobia]
MAQSTVLKVFQSFSTAALLAVFILLVPVVKVSGLLFSWFIPMADAAPQDHFRRAEIKGDAELMEAYRNGQSDLIVDGVGRVERLLADDLEGSRHQKFILRLESGQSLLVSHNIDVSPRIDTLREGDEVRFRGEYEWNERGGILHWTHDDPKDWHADGWLEHNGIRYD